MSYYRVFQPLFSEIAEPLNRLLRKGGPSVFRDAWGTEQQLAFDRLVASFCRDGLVVRTPDFDRAFYLHTDCEERVIPRELGASAEGSRYLFAWWRPSQSQAIGARPLVRV